MLTNALKYVNVSVQLADKRVLLFKREHGGSPQWSITIEQFLSHKDDQLVEANKILWKKFGIDTNSYRDSFAKITRLKPIEILPNRVIFPFTVKMKSALAFQCETYERYVAKDWYDILDDLMKLSIHHKKGHWPVHTPTAVFTAKELHIRRAFD